MTSIIDFIEKIVWSFPLVMVLIMTHLFFTIKLKFPQKYTFKGLKYMLFSDKKNSKEGISSFKSIMAVLAATLGTGNIIGVATAIMIGGVGSVFWIFISGVFAIATKYAETFIVLKYRKKDIKGYYGGSMYVLKERLGMRKLAVLFSLFVIFTSLGMGAMIQSNAITSTITQNFDVNIRVIAIIVTILCAYVLLGNEKRISNISSILIPIAVIAYCIACAGLLYIFRDNIGSSIELIMKEAFNFRAATGGILASVAIKAMSSGLSKGLFTNEAGMGTSPLFDSTVKETDVKKQSIMSSVTVFIDTVFLCTITGIIFVASGLYTTAVNPVAYAQKVFEFLPYGNIIFVFIIVIFAISTIPCAGFYGNSAIKYLFKSKPIYQGIFKMIFLSFVYFGSIFSIHFVWSISSISNALMVIPNIVMLYKLSGEIE
ncbi:MAG: amino acid carrier protein [Clostridia bacterium]|nr:amino acid carrier protein [Clostridia bacterium]